MAERGIFIKKGGEWVATKSPTVKVDGAFAPIKYGYANVNGSWQKFWPPLHVNVVITAAGGGGGGGGNDSHSGYSGFSGHTVSATLTLKTSDTINIYVGGGGSPGGGGGSGPGGPGGASAAGYTGGGGGVAGNEGSSGGGGGGGAASVVNINGDDIIVAGGGGGGGGGGDHSNGQGQQGYAPSGGNGGGAGQDKTGGGEHGGGGGSVICTKLFELGKLPQDVYDADEAYGQMIVAKYPYVYHGYRAWSGIVVDWMSGTGPQMMFWIKDDAERALAQTTWSRRWAEEIAIPWAEEMAYRMGKRDVGNKTGLAIMCLGVPISAVIGLWQQAFGKSNNPAGRIKGSLLIVAFTLLRGIVAVGDLFKGIKC